MIRLYSEMLRLRLLDQRMLTLQRQGRIGFYGTTTGEEAAVIGSVFALGPDDWIFPALRQGGAALFRGFPLLLYISQCMGNAADVLKGRQMPSHYSYRPAHFVSWSSCIGTQLPHAVGAAWAMKIRGDRNVAIGYMGDGATSEGDFHVAMNFAGVFKVPVVFFCQNNQWSISVSLKQQTASESIAVKAEAYGFEGVQVDGNDVLAVFSATRDAVRKARDGGGPTLIEALTYRMGAHSSSDDPRLYRSEAEVEEWRKKDPITRLLKYLQQQGYWSMEEQEALEEKLNHQILSAVEEAEKIGPPPLESLFEDVFAQIPPHLMEQRNSKLKVE
ncbi:MAG TPA: thiamine pyrophosphate-dependent dehydrogenase E1 component subunit alpha [Acidobacteriota bacterium]|nr:thiamine pyrophosphate-dependent dehydrogenase E1 component subunit alpha [Acidobacteriota bacterium]